MESRDMDHERLRPPQRRLERVDRSGASAGSACGHSPQLWRPHLLVEILVTAATK